MTLDGYCMHILLNSEGSDFVLKFICVFCFSFFHLLVRMYDWRILLVVLSVIRGNEKSMYCLCTIGMEVVHHWHGK